MLHLEPRRRSREQQWPYQMSIAKAAPSDSFLWVRPPIKPSFDGLSSSFMGSRNEEIGSKQVTSPFFQQVQSSLDLMLSTLFDACYKIPPKDSLKMGKKKAKGLTTCYSFQVCSFYSTWLWELPYSQPSSHPLKNKLWKISRQRKRASCKSILASQVCVLLKMLSFPYLPSK